MPTFDGGHYFLTALVPIRTGVEKPGVDVTSPVHTLLKRLDMLPPAQQTPACCSRQSPFASNKRNHFVRFVIIDDVAYNGRDQDNSILTAARKINPVVGQQQDHLSCPFLLFAAEFDADSGAESERDSYLEELWQTMENDLRDIFRFCQGFDQRVTDAASFAKYIAACQIETTMPFNDYYVDPPDLAKWPGMLAVAAAVLGALALLIDCVIWGWQLLKFGVFIWSWPLAIFGVVGILAAYAIVMAAGTRPFPAAPDAKLPIVLKALYLQRAFTRFAIDNQMLAAGVDAPSAQQLHTAFAGFVAANRPDDPGSPTQAPGVIGS
jgi:hypothetical protein